MQDALQRFAQLLRDRPRESLCNILPLMFKLKGEPFSIREGHFPQEPLYRMVGVARRQVTKAGRQVAKSTGLAASGIMRAAMTPHFNHLTVTPLFEQVRRFSSNYVKPFLIESSVKTSIMKPGTENSVLQRTLSNGAILHYNYASNSADRIRGLSLDQLDADEMQDFDLDILPVIQSCLSASKYKIERYSGTPKTFDGPLQVYWDLSSQAVWHIPCQTTGCKHENRCCVDGDILKMIDNPVTLVCAKCGLPVNSRLGYFVHGFPERQIDFTGYHLPQPIFPMHYADPKAWKALRDFVREKPKYMTYNEVLGESIDVGLNLLTRDELVAAAKAPWTPPKGFRNRAYTMTALGVDWGGKGKEKTTDKEEFISNTAMALGGMTHDGIVEINWVYRTPYDANHYAEAAIVTEAASDADSYWLAHDFGGAGDVRESIVANLGFPVGQIVPFTYNVMSPNKPIVFHDPSGPRGARSSYILDKSRSLLLFCSLVKAGLIRLPDWDQSKECLADFLSIYEETIETPRGKIKLVKRKPRRTDDVVHACNYVAMALYHSSGRWPDLASAFMKLNLENSWTPADA